MRCIKRKMSEPQYFIDDTPNNKDNSEYHGKNNDPYAQIPNINQIQPDVTISHMISSIKQSLDDLCTSLVPYSWSHAQRVYNQKNPLNEKKGFTD